MTVLAVVAIAFVNPAFAIPALHHADTVRR